MAPSSQPRRSCPAGTVTFSYHDFGPLATSEVIDGSDAAPAPAPEADPVVVPAEAEIDAATGPPLVLIHGFGSTQYDWPFAMLEALATNRRVIIFDNPRIGLSVDSSDAPLTIEYMANATLDFIAALGLDRPDILGYSMGADVALAMAATHADLVGAVVAGARWSAWQALRVELSGVAGC